MNDNSISVRIENGFQEDYNELMTLFENNYIKCSYTDIISNDDLGIDYSSLVILLPALYPYIENFGNILKSFLMYKKAQNPEFKLILENNGKKILIEAKNMEIPNIEDFKAFFES